MRSTGEVPAKRASAALGPAVSTARLAVAHVGTIPRRSAATTGRGMQLFAAVLRYSVTDAIALRLPVGELLLQAWTLLKVTATPALLMAIPFGAMVTVVTSGLVNQVGATSLLGAAGGVGVVRQGAPITAGLLMGGAAASAIASDFGARAIREELDAMRVMGVDPVRRLVVPAFSGVTPDIAHSVHTHYRGGNDGRLHHGGDGQRRADGKLLGVLWHLREGGGRLVCHR